MRVEKFSGSRGEWNRFVKANGGGLKQSYEWGEFRQELGWKAHRVVVSDKDGIRLTASVLQKPLPLGQCFFYCPEGPVVAGGEWNQRANQKAFEQFSVFLKQLAKSENALFLKIDPEVVADEFPLKWLGGLNFVDSPEDIQPAAITHVDLTPKEEDILAAMKQKGRYNVRYAIKKGVTVRSGTSEAELDTFYRLHEETSKRQGITYRSKDYYAAFRAHFMDQPDYAKFLIAELNGEPLAATLVSFFGPGSIYLYGGSSLQDRNVHAAYLVQWEGMKEARRRKCAFYNLTGIAASDDPNDSWAGLRQFKLKFGGSELHLIGARDYRYDPLRYTLFTQADRVRRFVAKRLRR
jgi:lipid II:glycine glycyltransferase (peptidoglycan interpeptide bridge formation enzyme)